MLWLCLWTLPAFCPLFLHSVSALLLSAVVRSRSRSSYRTRPCVWPLLPVGVLSSKNINGAISSCGPCQLFARSLPAAASSSNSHSLWSVNVDTPVDAESSQTSVRARWSFSVAFKETSPITACAEATVFLQQLCGVYAVYAGVIVFLPSCSEALARWWEKHRIVSGSEDGIYMWWCVFVNNQFRMLEAGQVEEPGDLFHVFGQQLEGIGKMLMCLDKMRGGQYTTRIWCIFEVFVACQRTATLWVMFCKLYLS